MQLPMPQQFAPATLEILILKALNSKKMHGFCIAQYVRSKSQDALRIEEGSLYPALHRLERKGWVTSEWRKSKNNRKAKFYQISIEGRKQLAASMAEWIKCSDAISRFFLPATE